jgi:hypothetical protein
MVGRTVASLLTDETISSDVRNFVGTEYKSRMALLEACLKKHFKGKVDADTMRFYRNVENPVFKMPFIVMQATFHPDEYSMASTQVMIKADGIIVDPHTLDFYLIDAE